VIVVLLFVAIPEAAKERKDLMDFVNEVLPDASEERSASTATAATGDGEPSELGDDEEVPALPNYAHYNLADMLRRRWAIHIRTMLSASGVSPPLGSGCSGGTVSPCVLPSCVVSCCCRVVLTIPFIGQEVVNASGEQTDINQQLGGSIVDCVRLPFASFHPCVPVKSLGSRSAARSCQCVDCNG
jgi:hypothetical protein